MKNEALIKARKKKGLTQEGLAEEVGCTKASISNWENGHSNPTLSDAFKVSEILGEDINTIFAGLKVQVSYTNEEAAAKEVI
jgi:DNA-binding XRE family transcriptional regulator